MLILQILCPIFSLGVFLPLFFLTQGRLRLVCKALGTACALIPALTGALQYGDARWLCVAALSLCIAADVVLDLQFIAGMGLFAAGHVLYVVWYLQRGTVALQQVLLLILLLAFTLVLVLRWRHAAPPGLLPPLIGYALILCIMTAFGVGLPLGNTALPRILTAIGAALFFISDIMVCRNVLFRMSTRFQIICMALYYAAQLLFGISTMFPIQ